MAYLVFGNVKATAFRPDYYNKERRYYSRGNHCTIETIVRGPLLTNSDQACKAGVEAALSDTSNASVGIFRDDTPVDTGLLRSRWYAKKISWDAWRVSNDIFYAPYQERRAQMMTGNLGFVESYLAKALDKRIPQYLN